MTTYDPLNEHYSVIVTAELLRSETLKHLPGLNHNQVPLESYIKQAREIVRAVFIECQRYHERMADQVIFTHDGRNEHTKRNMELMKADLFHDMLKNINDSAHNANTTNMKEEKE